MRTWIQDNMESDLAHIMTENGVPLALQYNIGQNFRSVRRFSALADSRADVRTTLRDAYTVEENTLERRAAVAAVVVSWEAAREYAQKDVQLRAEAKLLGVNRPVTQTDRAAMKAAYIAANGNIEEAFEPSDDYLSAKMEEQESHEPTASPLNEVTSKKTCKTLGIQTSIDSSGAVRIVKQKQHGALPQGTEELRTSLRTEGNTWCYLAAKYRNKPMMQNMTPAIWLNYANFLLGEKCYMMKVPSGSGSGATEERTALKPPWSIMLTYEYELRKEAVKKAFHEGRPLAVTLPEVCNDSQIKEQYFTSPIALQGRTHQDRSMPPSSQWKKRPFEGYQQWQPSGKGGKAGKGKGKGGKGKGKSPRFGRASGTHSEHGLVSHTPDGREICFAFNGQGCDGACGRVHVCRVRGCTKQHPMWQHFAEQQKDGGSKGGTN